jgi:hypothetical protein
MKGIRCVFAANKALSFKWLPSILNNIFSIYENQHLCCSPDICSDSKGLEICFQNAFTANTFHDKYVTNESYLIKNVVHVFFPMK